MDINQRLELTALLEDRVVTINIEFNPEDSVPYGITFDDGEELWFTETQLRQLRTVINKSLAARKAGQVV